MPASFAELADKGVEGARKQEAEGGDPDHPEQHSSAEGLRHSDPAPVAIARGKTPRMKAKEVMRIGRRRVWAADVAASSGGSTPSPNFLGGMLRITFGTALTLPGLLH